MKHIIQQITEEMGKEILKKIERHSLDLNRLTEAVLEDCKQTTCRIIEAFAQETDRKIRDDREGRRERGLVLKEKGRPRRVLTELGELHLKRDYYRDQKRGCYTTPLDELLGIQRYERILSTVGAALVQQAADVSYEKSARIVTGGAVSRQTVRNQILKRKGLEKEAAFEKKEVKELHVFADEDHVHLQKPGKEKGKKNQMVPAVTVTEGVKAVSRNRNRTVCPMHFVDEEFNTKRLWESVSGYIQKAYDVSKLERIYVHADGGNWIRHGLKEYAQTVHVMDGFHFERELKRTAARFRGKNVRHRIRTALKEKDRKEADRIVQSLLEASENEETGEKVKKFGGYLMTHWEEIVRRYQEGTAGSCTEGQISHLLSERFSRDPMGWSREGLGKLSAARVYIKNGGKIRGDDLKEGKKTETYREYGEQMLEESIKGAMDWSVVEQREPLVLDPASGTRQIIHRLGSSRGWRN